jgi:hypothetical protein
VSAMNHSRRDFLLVSLGVASASVATLPLHAARAAPAQNLPHLSPGEPLAQSLGYVNDGSHANRARFPTYKPGERCDHCRFYKGTVGQAWGPCQIFVGKSVNAHGWCASFMMKT